MNYDKKVFAKNVQATKDEIAKISKPIFDACAEYQFEHPYVSKEEEAKNHCVKCGTELRQEINTYWNPEGSYAKDCPSIHITKKCPKCNPVAEEKAENKNDPVKDYAVTALDGAYAGARGYLLDSYEEEYVERIKKMDVREAIKSLEINFLEWQKTGRRDLQSWDSAIFVIDIIIAAGILHEKLREVEALPQLDNESEKEKEEETD